MTKRDGRSPWNDQGVTGGAASVKVVYESDDPVVLDGDDQAARGITSPGGEGSSGGTGSSGERPALLSDSSLM